MILRFFSLLFALILVPLSGLTEECKNIRLDGAAGPFSKIPVYDQKRFSESDSNICYAVTSSQLIDADRFFKGESLESLTSPISVAIAHKRKWKTGRESTENPLESGQTERALAAISNQSVCDQKYLEKYVGLIGKNERNPLPPNLFNHHSVSSSQNFFRSINDQAENFRQQDAILSAATQNLSGNQSNRRLCPEPLNQFFMSRIERNRIGKIASALQTALRQENEIDRIADTVDSICSKNRIFIDLGSRIKHFDGYTTEEKKGFSRKADLALKKISDPNLSENEQEEAAQNFFDYSFPKPNPDQMVKKANALLGGKYPVPIEITIHSAVLKKGPTKGGGPHSAIIIGQRPGANQCEFLVRNSYGPTCNFDGGYGYDCKDGNIWVPQDRLFSDMMGMTWIDREGKSRHRSFPELDSSSR